MKAIQIVVVQIINRNLGDGVISDCTKFLIKKICKRLIGKKVSIVPYNIYSEDFSIIKRADVIVFAGGGIIKYKYEKFYSYITGIVKIADQYQIPVFFNGVGVEGFDGSEDRCMELKETLNLECVKGITVRDDIETLRNNYIVNHNIRVRSVFDPAVWTKEVYRIERRNTSDVVGVGIVRYKIFADNGIEEIDENFQLKLWSELICLLNQRNIKWKIFTNGLKSDEDFAVQVLQYAGYGEEVKKYKVKRAADSRELVQTIAGFKAIIACRLHANIIAYSLGIPSIAFVWNDKLKFWGRKIGKEELFIEPAKMSAEYVISALQKLLINAELSKPSSIKRLVYKELKRFIRKYAKRRNKVNFEKILWEEHLMATALGGENFLFSGMNNLKMLEESSRSGFRWMETDIRLTSDNKLACVNGWNKGTYSRLGVDDNIYGKAGMPLKEFLTSTYYGKFAVTDAVKFFDKIKMYPNINFVLDAGRPEKKKLSLFYAALKKVSTENMTNIYIRIQREADVLQLREEKIPFSLIYYIEDIESVDNVVKLCKKYGIKWISIKIEKCEKVLIKKLKDNGLKICVFSVDKLIVAEELLKLGVDLISSNYLKVDVLTSLFA